MGIGLCILLVLVAIIGGLGRWATDRRMKRMYEDKYQNWIEQEYNRNEDQEWSGEVWDRKVKSLGKNPNSLEESEEEKRERLKNEDADSWDNCLWG